MAAPSLAQRAAVGFYALVRVLRETRFVPTDAVCRALSQWAGRPTERRPIVSSAPHWSSAFPEFDGAPSDIRHPLDARPNHTRDSAASSRSLPNSPGWVDPREFDYFG